MHRFTCQAVTPATCIIVVVVEYDKYVLDYTIYIHVCSRKYWQLSPKSLLQDIGGFKFGDSVRDCHTYMYTIESHDYAPPPSVHGQKWAMGRGLIRGILIFPCNDHYQPSNATWVRNLCTFSGCLVGKTREKRLSKA